MFCDTSNVSDLILQCASLHADIQALQCYAINCYNPITLVIPSYSLHTKGGEGVIWTPYYVINTLLYKRQRLQGIRGTLQGLRKCKICKKSFVWLPWQLFDNMVLFANNCQNDYEKQVIFKCSQKPQIRRC